MQRGRGASIVPPGLVSAIQLTERLLNDAGGWQAMKAARALHEAGRVLEAAWDPPLLRGRVREGETEFRAGLTINSARDVTNLCTCRTSRQHGMICAHSLAAGLECLRPRRRVENSPNTTLPETRSAAGEPSTLITKNGIRLSIESGVEIAVALVLTPNLAAAILNGNVTVVPEVLLPERVPLASLAPGKTYRCSRQDFRLLEQLIRDADGQLPSALSLAPDGLARLLPLLVDHPRITLGRGLAVAVRGEPRRLRLLVTRDPSGGLRLRAVVPPNNHLLAASGQAWLFELPNTLIPLPPGLPGAYETLLDDEVVIPESGVAAFHAREAPLLRNFFDFELPALPAHAESDEPLEFHLKLEGSLNHLDAELEAVAGNRRTRITAPGYCPRQRAETAALERLTKCGFERSNAGSAWKLKGEPRILLFFARDLPQLERDWKVSIGSRFEHVTRDLTRTAPQLNIRASGENWFDVGIEFSAGGSERIAASEIRRLLRSGQNAVRLRNGKRAVIHEGLLDEFEQVLRDCNPDQRQPGLYRFDQRDAAYLSSLRETVGAQFSGPDLFAPETLSGDRAAGAGSRRFESILRDYQKQGVAWLNVLARKKWSGILADEMGLGKTVQTLAFLSQLEGTSLVVCPSSLVINWQREADRFAPELRAHAVTGPDRARHVSSRARLLITSYALLRRDVDAYRGREFAVVVLDEAQHIKNPDSQAAQAAFGLRGRHRMALTGTPIENSVRDIWSIMNFLMPGYLGSRAEFKERYEQPIANEPGGAAHGRLVRRLRPFVLRRTKREVAKELPEKIRQVLFCELNGAQRSVYGSLLTAAQGVIAEAGRENPGAQRLAALTALLRLRQACLDLRLLGLSDDSGPEVPSAKLELLCELLDEALADGHRVLVFSQFAQMLGLIRAELAAREIGCGYLDGSTRDRQSQIDQFQQGHTPVFLISLKAGGVGLNLTAADTVIHFDPWWNPAVEDQATDRAHRIGQERVVTVYQLIARGTVEEKILALQTRKRQIGDLTVESDQPLMTGLQMDDLRDLVAEG